VQGYGASTAPVVTPVDASTPIEIEEPSDGPEDAQSEPEDPGPMPPNLLRVPGFVNGVMDYCLRTAPYPEETLALCGALALQALLAGRKVRDPGDNRTTIYLLGLANSGAGKDHPRKVNQKVILAACMRDAIGDAFASGEGIEDRLFATPAVLFQTDEVNGLMLAIRKGQEVRHENIMNTLLKFYSSANAVYTMRVRAGQEQQGIIDQPCLCIFATAIPGPFYESLSMRMLDNGFAARMLVLEAGRRGTGQDAVIEDVPASIAEVARWWAALKPGHGDLREFHPVPVVVDMTPEAQEILNLLRGYADRQYAKAEDQNDSVGMTIWARANEKARRLALIYACSADHENPLINENAALWASEFVNHQTKRMLYMAHEHVFENEFDARCKRLVGMLRKWQSRRGEAWMPAWRIGRKLPWIEREFEEVRTALIEQRIIEYAEVPTKGRTARAYRLVAAAS
jgi:hypothetical protein